MLKVLFFGQLKEQLKTNELSLLEEFHTVADLRQHLQRTNELWHSQLTQGKTLVAVNQSISDEDTRLSARDEVAFFPPVTGG